MMTKPIKYFMLCFGFVMIGLLVGFKIKSQLPSSGNLDDGLKKVREALIFIERNYVEQPNHQQLIDQALYGMMESLDPHSNYIPADEMRVRQEELSGSYEGIGVQFNILEDTMYVEATIVDGPSEKLGIQAGDRIIKVNGQNIAGIGLTDTDVWRYLKGPKGTSVDLSILRRGSPKLLEFTVVRDQIPLHSVNDGLMLDGQTGYLRVTRFAKTTHLEFRQQLQDLLDQGMENLILDLRSNPGGLLHMANKLADEFLPEGKLIVSTEGRIPESRQKYHATSALGAFETGTLIVLIDYGSASASEIVAGAVQDHDRGLIVGVRSFGKGLVQTEEIFEDGSALRLVISKYYTPSGRCIQKPYDKSSEDYAHEIEERFQSGEIFDKSKIQVPDSLIYKTEGGRTVYGGGGIYPDKFAPADTSARSNYLLQLRNKDLFRRFAADYVDARPQLKTRYPDAQSFVKRFRSTMGLMQQFIDYAEEKGLPYADADYRKSERLIRNQVRAYIGQRLFNEAAFYPILLEVDAPIQKALSLLPLARELQATGTLLP